MNFSNGHAMNRDEWEFDYAAERLAKAAEKKMLYRQSRVKWWEEQKAAVLAQIKESGIEVNEGIGAKYSNSTAQTPQVMVRADLQTKLTECHNKIREHMSAAREYDGWRQILTANISYTLKLKNGDWLYFFGED